MSKDVRGRAQFFIEMGMGTGMGMINAGKSMMRRRVKL